MVAKPKTPEKEGACADPRAALAELGHDLDEILACEEEPGLGNGGLGRLAAALPGPLESGIDCQEQVSETWADAQRWTRMSILNTARCGKFSSDRAIAGYCDGIWGVRPAKVKL